MERHEDGGVAGRFFVKQNHQGPPGQAHGGLIATALDEAMSLLLHGTGTFALTGRLEIESRVPRRWARSWRSWRMSQRPTAAGSSSPRAPPGEDGPIGSAGGTFVEVAGPKS